MLSKTLDKISFWLLFVVISLLPIFFLPFSKIPVEISKSLLLVSGLSLSVIFWAVARFSDGKIVLPKSWFTVSGLSIIFIFLLSALFSSTLNVSFFGTIFDSGTFWFIFAAFLLMFMSSIFLKDSKNIKKIFSGIILSSVFLFIFQILYLLLPNIFSLGILGEKTSNLLGSWNSFAVFAGLSAILVMFFIDFFALSKMKKVLLFSFLALALFFIALVNFYLVWIVLGIFAVFIFIYKISFSIGDQKEENKRIFPVASFIVFIISLMFFISGQFLGGILPSLFGVSNTDIRPSFSATVSVTKSALIKNPILGVGPNKFTEIWNMYKPQSINGSAFWNSSFDEGFGLLSTFPATTGILGTLTWLVFLGLLCWTGFKLFFVSPKDRILDIKNSIFFMASFYLFIVSLFYPIGQTLFLLALAFLGIFIGLSTSGEKKEEIEISFLDDMRKSFFVIFGLIVIIIITIFILFKYTERFVSVSYFQKAVTAENIETAESNINKAISLYSNDLYLRTFAQVYLTKINLLVSKVSGGAALSETEKKELQSSFELAVKSAEMAIEYNKMNYMNFEMLGSVYEGGISLGVKDIFDKAVDAYNTASTLNPLNPSLKLNLTRLYFSNKDIQKAKISANEALSLKQDYVDTLIVLSQISKSEGNNTESISYAEKAVYLYPENKELQQYLDSLKNSNNSNTVVKNKK